ncbi:MAG: hypothetical protein K8S56_00550, partial [Candidatus Cloacimonetes bacterium]|nr:hypothetical protein [Candidatus Cloacimonadota bacterium]
MAITLILCAALIIRLWPWFTRLFASSDAWLHLFICNQLKANKLRLPDENPQFILGGKTRYPPLYHYFMLLIPKRYRERYSFLLTVLFDMAVVGLILLLHHSGVIINSQVQ